MGLFEDGLKGVGPSLLVSVGAIVAAPILIPAVMGGLRPLAKTVIKGYVFLSDSLKESMAEAGEQIGDLVAEVREETAAEGNETSEHETTGGSRRGKRRGR